MRTARPAFKVGAVAREVGEAVEVGGVEQAVRYEQLGADEQRVAGEGGRAGVRRAAVAAGHERQHLPDALPGAFQEVSEAVSGRAEIAESEGTRKGSQVEQKAASARHRAGREGRNGSGASYARTRPDPALPAGPVGSGRQGVPAVSRTCLLSGRACCAAGAVAAQAAAPLLRRLPVPCRSRRYAGCCSSLSTTHVVRMPPRTL